MSQDLGRDIPDCKSFMQENFGLIFRSLQEPKRTLKPKHRTKSTKEFFEQFEDTTH